MHTSKQSSMIRITLKKAIYFVMFKYFSHILSLTKERRYNQILGNEKKLFKYNIFVVEYSKYTKEIWPMAKRQRKKRFKNDHWNHGAHYDLVTIFIVSSYTLSYCFLFLMLKVTWHGKFVCATLLIPAKISQTNYRKSSGHKVWTCFKMIVPNVFVLNRVCSEI